jgi:hypothetical protein
LGVTVEQRKGRIRVAVLERDPRRIKQCHFAVEEVSAVTRSGWDLADVILDLGYVRPDGKTLIGQPSIEQERLWTIDDIRRLRYEVKDPLHE